MNRLRTKRWGSFILTITMTFFALALPQPARAELVYNIHFPVNFTDYNPCTNNGAGEMIEFTGALHVLWTITLDGTSGYHAHVTENYQGVSGVGLTTGIKYQCSAAVHENFTGKVGQTYSLGVGIRYMGQGARNDFIQRIMFHYTVNANGEPTSYIDSSSIECK